MFLYHVSQLQGFEKCNSKNCFFYWEKSSGPWKLLIKMSDVSCRMYEFCRKLQTLLSIVHYFNVFLKLIDQVSISIQKQA